MDRISSNRGLREAIKPQTLVLGRVLLTGFDAKNLQMLWLSVAKVSTNKELATTTFLVFFAAV
jgi:hypothetical protein